MKYCIYIQNIAFNLFYLQFSSCNYFGVSLWVFGSHPSLYSLNNDIFMGFSILTVIRESKPRAAKPTTEVWRSPSETRHSKS